MESLESGFQSRSRAAASLSSAVVGGDGLFTRIRTIAPTTRYHLRLKAKELLRAMLPDIILEIYDLNPVLKLDRVDDILRPTKTADGSDSMNDYRGIVPWGGKKDSTHTAEVEPDRFVSYRHAVVVTVAYQRLFICIVNKAEDVLSFLVRMTG